MRDLDEIRSDLGTVQAFLDEIPSLEEDPYSIDALERRQYLQERDELMLELEEADAPRLEVVLEGTGVYGHTVTVDLLSDLLGRLQDAVRAVAQSLQGPTTARGLISGDVVAASQLRFATSFAGSFGAKLLGPVQAVGEDLFGQRDETLLERSVSQVIGVVEVAQTAGVEEDDRIVDAVLPLGPRAVTHLESLSTVIARGGNSAELILHRPGHEDRAVKLRQGVARRLQAVLSRATVVEEELEVEGLLGGASEFKNHFELGTPLKTYAGGVPDELLPLLRGAYGHQCRCTILVRRSQPDAGKAPKESYTLIALDVLDG